MEIFMLIFRKGVYNFGICFVVFVCSVNIDDGFIDVIWFFINNFDVG